MTARDDCADAIVLLLYDVWAKAACYAVLPDELHLANFSHNKNYNVQHRPFLASLRAVATDGGDVGRSAIKDHLAADFKSEHINTALATFVSSTEGGYISGKHTEIVYV